MQVRLVAARAGAGPVSNPAADPHSGQPELKHVPVRVTREAVRWEGLLLTRRSENATVTLCHTGTRDLAKHVREADVVCTCTSSRVEP